MKTLAILALTLPLAACDLNPILGKPFEAQKHHERMSKPAEGVNFVQARLEPETLPECHENFRVNRCVGGLSVDWFYGDAP